jgi:phosphoribosylamine--glycine ligase
MTDAMIHETMRTIIEPTIQAMNDRGTPYTGVLYAGLMITETGPRLIEYNVRFGDPECQVLCARLDSDLLPALQACGTGTLDQVRMAWKDQAALVVVMAARGYPGDYVTNTEIGNLQAAASEDVIVLHAGTRRTDSRLLSAGGRVLGITAIGDTVGDARDRAYAAIDKIDWPDGFYRTDIGWRAIAREQEKEKEKE